MSQEQNTVQEQESDATVHTSSANWPGEDKV